MIGILIRNKEYRQYEISEFSKYLTSEIMIVFYEDLMIETNVVSTRLLYRGNELKLKKVLNWLGSALSEFDNYLFTYFKTKKIKVINSFEQSMLFKHKLALNTHLSSKQIPIIPSIKFTNNDQYLKSNFEYPLIFKSDWGSFGKGIYKVNNQQELTNIIDHTLLVDQTYQFFIQPFIDYQRDIRVFIIGKQCIAMERIPKANDFIANITHGGQAKPINLNQFEKRLVSRIIKEFPNSIIGVDILSTSNTSYICEINSGPNFKGIQSIVSKPIAREIINFLIAGAND
ncbi:MAG: ATP-grasp domain-containing protein [Mycoplasmatales bacterium]